MDEQTSLVFTVTATDSDVPANGLTYSARDLPTGATFDPSAKEFSWTPGEDQDSSQPYVVTFRVDDDGTPALFDEQKVAITVHEVNRKPTLVAIEPKIVDEQTALVFTVTAADPDVPVNGLTYYAADLPTGATFDAATQQFSWTPGEDQDSSQPYVVTFRVDDDGTPALSDEQEVAITVNEVNRRPEFVLVESKVVDEQTALVFTVTATDSDVPANGLTYSARDLPTGAAFDPSTQEFSWTPGEDQDRSEPYMVTFRVDDDGTPALFDEQEVAIAVNEVPTRPIVTIDRIEDEVGRQIADNDILFIGQTVYLWASFIDPDIPAAYTAEVAWGDGSVALLGSVTPGELSLLSHTYEDQTLAGNLLNITVSVDDSTFPPESAARVVKIVTASIGVSDVTNSVTDLLDSGILNPEGAQSVQDAIDLLIGNNGGAASNGATDQMALENFNAALVKIREAIHSLEDAEAADPSLDFTSEKRILALGGAAVSDEAVANAEEIASTPKGHQNIDAAKQLTSDGRALIQGGDFLGSIDLFQEALTYLKSPPKGKKSFTVIGLRLEITSISGTSESRSILFRVSGPAGNLISLERSEDLKEWETVEALEMPLNGDFKVRVQAEGEPVSRFYRLRHGDLDSQ